MISDRSRQNYLESEQFLSTCHILRHHRDYLFAAAKPDIAMHFQAKQPKGAWCPRSNSGVHRNSDSKVKHPSGFLWMNFTSIMLVYSWYVIFTNPMIPRSERVFYCGGCPPLQIRTSQCDHGQRLRHFLFFTLPATGHHIPGEPCIAHTITRRESCEPIPTSTQGETEQ